MGFLLRGVVAATALTTALLTATTGAPAHAVTGSPPTPAADHVTMRAGGMREVDLIANDTDPDGDALQVCRIGHVPSSLFVESEGGTQVFVMATRAGTYTFTYYACDLSYLAPATVTVTVKPRPKMYLLVRKAVRPGMLRVANHGSFRIDFAFGSYKADKADGQRVLRAHTSMLVPVRRHSLVWVAVGRNGAFRLGIVRGIALPAGVDALPAGAPPKGASLAGRWAAQHTALRW